MTAMSAGASRCRRFSTLQRVEIAEIKPATRGSCICARFSTLQRVEIAEIIKSVRVRSLLKISFSTLQRVEIAEIDETARRPAHAEKVSVLFNESKLLKSSAGLSGLADVVMFQYSSTSRNC